MYKLAIITTHPIQYNAPWFKLLNEGSKLSIKVFYTWGKVQTIYFDSKFGRQIAWDIPLLSGYEHTFLANTAKNPQTHSFFGIQNPSLIQEIANFKADAILVFGWKFRSHLQVMYHFKNKVPILFRGDSTLLDTSSKFKSLIRRMILKWVYHYVDFALYVGSENKRYFKAYGLKEAQLIFAPHAIDNKRFEEIDNKSKIQLKQWKLELDIKEKDIVILFVGKFEKKKSPLNIIKAAKRINRPELKFLFVGNGELENQMKKETKSNFLFIPFQNQSKMPLVYRLGDVLILPSAGPGETWGLAVNEAMASGIPAIVSNKVGCHKDLILKDKTGFLFAADDVEQLADIFSRLDKQKLKKMGIQAQELIKKWSFKNICRAIENCLYLLKK